MEELYDTQSDPHEIHNLAADPAYAELLSKMRGAHLQWVNRTKDLGLIAEPILAEQEKRLGPRYGILRQAEGDKLIDRIAQTAARASSGKSALPQLLQALEDPNAAVRYWGATGIGNIGMDAKTAQSAIQERLNDKSAVVRIAAARALCRFGVTGPALETITKELRKGEQWERLHAAIVLDEIGAQAAPVKNAMESALNARKDLYAGGKYTVRVINRALNQLNGTNRSTP